MITTEVFVGLLVAPTIARVEEGLERVGEEGGEGVEDGLQEAVVVWGKQLGGRGTHP